MTMLAWLAALPFLVFGLYLVFMSLADYRPGPEIGLETEINPAVRLKRGTPFTVMTLNIGYGGMDAGADFFMDGGRGSRGASRERTGAAVGRIAAFLAAEHPDLALLQEVDRRATRSYGIDELHGIAGRLPAHGRVFALNYKVPWVPVPLNKPMGAVTSGLLTFSRFHVDVARRLRLPGKEPWPRQLAELDRCLCECRLPLAGGGELVLFNLHLSAFDRGGRIRRLQLEFLRERLLAERRKGSGVIAGGDWNHGLPGSDPGRFRWTGPRPAWYVEMPDGFPPAGFRWAVDAGRPTVRASSTPYRPGESFVAVIDGFLVSDNVEVRRVAVRDLGFADSDHNPVVAEFVIN
ncbi:MAG TPA: endonuclease/exonuclease/phosphatase family protein [Candidatus Aminicenantes bacterium]|nr:endonuclease/exonuclease/phosphatase family protein [Candidatus Aminicenantes bacterium]